MKKAAFSLISVVVSLGILFSVFGIFNAAAAQGPGQEQVQVPGPDSGPGSDSDLAAAREPAPGSAAESIASYSAFISVNADNSVDVTEIIQYSTGPISRHGIYRDINPYSSEGRRMSIENVLVTDESGNEYQYTTSRVGREFRLKIGDPETTFSGQKTYVISYKATNAVAQLQEIDEIYWNVTGNEWSMPILHAEAYVTLPAGAEVVQNACYFGPAKSRERCQLSVENAGEGVGMSKAVYLFRTPASLDAGEGLTVALGFQKGAVIPYTAAENAWQFLGMYLSWILAMLLPIATFALSFRHWRRHGRDPKGTGVIVPQYDVIDGLTPMEADGIAHEKVGENNISAELIYLAVRGYIRINQIEAHQEILADVSAAIKKSQFEVQKILTRASKAGNPFVDYEIVKLGDFSDLPNEFDRKLLSAIFKSGGASVKLSDLKYAFYSDVALIKSSVLDALVSKGYYRNLGRMKEAGDGSFRTLLIALVGLWLAGVFGTLISIFVLRVNPFPLIGGIFLSVVIYGIISKFNPSKTEKGVAAKEHLLGLKEYLQIAEKDRLEFHNAPEKRPEVFERLLPYAMVLGVSAIWAKEFEDMYLVQPSWYSGPSGSAFNAAVLSSALSDFSSHASSSMTAMPSSGSGGGGSSGGGGGGGGGGSW